MMAFSGCAARGSCWPGTGSCAGWPPPARGSSPPAPGRGGRSGWPARTGRRRSGAARRLRRERAGRVAVDVEAAQDLALAHERDRERGAHAGAQRRAGRSGLPLAASSSDVRHLHRLAGRRGARHQAAAVAPQGRGVDLRDEGLVEPVGRPQRERVGDAGRARRRRRSRSRRGARRARRCGTSTSSRSSVEVTVRVTSPSAVSWSTERVSCSLAVLQLLEQPGVLDGDHGLVGEGLQQRDLRGR